MQSSALVSRQRLLRLLLVVGAAIGVALAVLEGSGSSGRSFYRELPGIHRREASCDDRKCERNRQGPWEGFALPAKLPESENYQVRPPFRGNEGPVHEMEHHRPRHSHHEHDKESDDNDDSEDDNDKESDDDDDSEDDKDDEEDSDSSESGSQSDNGSQSGGIQSSAITRLGGVNIGNTITIINVGSGGAVPSSSQQGSGPSGGVALPSSSQQSSGPRGGVPSNSIPPAGNGVGRAAISAAAVRAFCDSMGCSPGKIFQGSLAGSGSATFSISPSTNVSSGFGGGSASAASSSSGGNSTGTTRNEATYANSAIHNGSSILSMRAVKWLVLVAILFQLT